MIRYWICCAVLPLLVAGACLRLSRYLEDKRVAPWAQIHALDEEIQAAKTDVPTVTHLRDMIESQQMAALLYGDYVGLVDADTAGLVQVLEAVEKARPRGVSVTSLTLTPGGQPSGFSFIAEQQPGHPPPPEPRLQLSATSSAPQSLDNFENALAHLAVCDRLVVHRMPSGPVTFEMWCKPLTPP